VTLLRTFNASFKDLCGAAASVHRLAGSSDFRPSAANDSRLHGRRQDVSANQVLHGARGLGAVSQRDELQLRRGDVLRLAGGPEERPQGEQQWSPLLVWRRTTSTWWWSTGSGIKDYELFKHVLPETR